MARWWVDRWLRPLGDCEYGGDLKGDLLTGAEPGSELQGKLLGGGRVARPRLGVVWVKFPHCSWKGDLDLLGRSLRRRLSSSRCLWQRYYAKLTTRRQRRREFRCAPARMLACAGGESLASRTRRPPASSTHPSSENRCAMNLSPQSFTRRSIRGDSCSAEVTSFIDAGGWHATDACCLANMQAAHVVLPTLMVECRMRGVPSLQCELHAVPVSWRGRGT